MYIYNCQLVVKLHFEEIVAYQILTYPNVYFTIYIYYYLSSSFITGSDEKPFLYSLFVLYVILCVKNCNLTVHGMYLNMHITIRIRITPYFHNQKYRFRLVGLSQPCVMCSLSTWRFLLPLFNVPLP